MSYYSIRNEKSDTSAEILIYDRIGESWFSESVTAKQFVKDLRAIGKKDVTVRINSPGGSVIEGNAIYNALKAYKGRVSVVIDGAAFSMASVVAMAGDTVEMSKNALMMIHNPRGFAEGEAKDFRAYADLLDKSREGLVQAYVDKTSRPKEEIVNLLDAETWFSASEALEAGFIDSIGDSNLAVAASFDLDSVEASGVKVPKKYAEALANFAIQKETKAMSENTTPQAATVSELKALQGADSDFVVAQLEAKATLQDATAALNARLFAQLSATAAAKDASDKKLAEAMEAKEKGGAGLGVSAPVGTISAKTDGISLGNDSSADVVAWNDDPIAFYNAEFEKQLQALNNDAVKASDSVLRRHKGLAEAMRAKALSI